MEKFFNFEKLNGITAVKFIAGDYVEKAGELFKKNAPMGKVAFIALSETHKKRSKSLFAPLNSAGSKIISLIMPEPVKYTVDYFSVLFNLPEEIRTLITFDRELYKAASYFAAIRGIPLIYVPESACVADTLESKFYIRNGGNFDLVDGAAEIYVIVDESIIVKDVAAGYAFNMARLTTLLDYRVSSAVEGKADATAYLTVRDAVLGTYTILSEKPEERALCSLYNGFKIAVSDRAESFSFIRRSAERISTVLFSGIKAKPETEFFYSLKIMEFYSEAFKIKEEAEIFPDYSGRAENVSALLKTDRSDAVRGILDQTEIVRKNLSVALKTMNAMQKETEELFSHKSGILGTFYALGGAETPMDAHIIKYAGDTTFGINALSFLRETGITDHVKNR